MVLMTTMVELQEQQQQQQQQQQRKKRAISATNIASADGGAAVLSATQLLTGCRVLEASAATFVVELCGAVVLAVETSAEGFKYRFQASERGATDWTARLVAPLCTHGSVCHEHA